MLENKYDRHRRHVEKNQLAQIRNQKEQLQVQQQTAALSEEQLKLAQLQHEELMAAQREQADQARKAQWATWIQTNDGRNYLNWEAKAVAWCTMINGTLETWNGAWTTEFEAADGRSAMWARGSNQWIGSPKFKTAAIWLGVLAVLTLLKGLIFGFGAISTIVLIGSIAGAAFCAWKHVTDWAPRNDAERQRVTEELNRKLGHDVFDAYPEWPALFIRQSDIEDAVMTLHAFIDKAPDTFPTTYPVIPSYSFTRVTPRWPKSVQATHAELCEALS